MKKLFSSAFAFITPLFLFSQTALVKIPIDSINLYNDISSFQNNVDFYCCQPEFTYDKYLVDSSSIKTNFRGVLEIDPSSIVGLEKDSLVFSIHAKFEFDSSSNSYVDGYAVLFGQKDNIGLMFDNTNQTIYDTDSLVSHKLSDPQDWSKIALKYYEDSIVKLVINDTIIKEGKRNSNQFLNNSIIEIGGYYNSYTLASVDSIEILTGSNSISIESPFTSEDIEISLYPNPTSSKIFVTNNNYPVIFELFTLQGKRIKIEEGHFIDLSDFASGYYILKVIIGQQENTFRVLKN